MSRKKGFIFINLSIFVDSYVDLVDLYWRCLQQLSKFQNARGLVSFISRCQIDGQVNSQRNDRVCNIYLHARLKLLLNIDDDQLIALN